MFPTLSAYQRASQRRYGQTPGDGRDTAVDDESYVFVDQSQAPLWNRTASAPAAKDPLQQSSSNHRAGIRPGAPPAQRVFPPRPNEVRRETAPAASYQTGGVGRQTENWYTTTIQPSNGVPVYSGDTIVDSGIRMADGRDPFATSQAFLSGYADGYGEASGYAGYEDVHGNGGGHTHKQENGYGTAIYAYGGYAPRYQDGHVSRYSHSPEEQENAQPVTGLGLLRVPETAEPSSVTRRSAIFRDNGIASNGPAPRSRDVEYLESQLFSSSLPVPPPLSSNALNQVQEPEVNRRTETRENQIELTPNGAGLSGAPRPESMVSSWGTVVESVGAGSLDSLEQVNNFQRGVAIEAGQGLQDYASEEEGSRTPRVLSQHTPSQAPIQSSALGLLFEPVGNVASERSHSDRRPRHGRSSSMPIGALEETDSRPRHRRAPRDGDRPRTRTASVQHHSDPQLEFSGSLNPTTTNALALSFDGPVDQSVNSQPRVDTHGRSHIVAPTPIVRQNIIQSWGLGS
jgi:hypothetical protein